MLRTAHEQGLGIDVVSLGELVLALRAGIPANTITFHGAAKTDDELATAVRAQVGHLVIDDTEEVEALIAVARRLDARPRVLLRINPGVAVSTDARYRTSGADCKFGMSLADGSAVRAARAALASQHLDIDGVHFHLGSQLMTAEPYAEAMAATATFIAEVGDWAPHRIVVGGGMGVRYGDGPAAPTPAQWANWLASAFRGRLAPVCAPEVALGIEPGRSVPAAHGTTLYTVGAVKPRSDRPGEAIVIVDGGLSDNPRPLMYSATHPVRSVSARDGRSDAVVQIYGRHCETDLLFPDVTLPQPRRGDVLAVATTGAYVHCMASNYNRFTRPPVVFAEDGHSRLVVRRETPDDLCNTEVES
jgi:diaminopimelate decarboxylase